VFHLHGWLHFDWFLEGLAKPLGGAQFAPYNASSTLSAAFQKNWLIPVGYAIGVASCIFHLSNGIWSFGVRWGLWISPAAMRRAGLACTGFGLALGAVSLGALTAPLRMDADEARRIEKEMYDARVSSHEVEPNPHKRAAGADDAQPSQQNKSNQEPAPASPSDGTVPTATGNSAATAPAERHGG
jgi:succinate dehydrogenase / fumarate reductase cytochrome b subunit